ncbi:MAG: MATE family efflux transporter [Bacteroidales bacterium]|jgi:MATE family multidrug resistance protein|nr:MATE family efflux transporter [Bacteroidales bacterium]
MSIQRYFPFYKRNLVLAFPIILSHIGQVTVSIVDTFMVGILGTVELASVAFASSIFSLIFIFGLGFSLGQTPHVGKAFGKKQWWKIGVIFQNSLLINITLGVLLTVVMLFLTPVLYHLNQPIAVVNVAMPYYKWLLLSTVPVLIFFSCRQFAEGVGNTKIAMWVTISGNILNIILNYVLIFGKFGFPPLGVEGAGISTLIVRSLMALIFVVLVFRNNVLKRFTQYFSLKKIHIKAIITLFKTGFPISGQLVVEVLAFCFSAIMIGWINEVNLAAHQIVLQLASATFMVGLGVGSASTILISQQFGSKRYNVTQITSLASLHLVTIFNTLTAVAFIVLRYQIPSWFSSDPEVIYVAAQLMIIAGIFHLFDGWQMVGLASLRGLADVTFAMFIAITSYLIISLPVGYFLGFVCNLGSAGIWTGLCIGLILASIAYRVRFVSFMKRYKKR